MFATFLLALREGLEAALIIGIILGVLSRGTQAGLKKSVWAGTGLAILISIVAATLLHGLGAEFEGQAEQLYEGFAMLLAAGLLTWMIFWMQKQSRTLYQKLESEVKTAVGKGSIGLFWLAFLAVMREGLELALFVFAASRTTDSGQTIVGTVLGLGVAIILGVLLFTSTRKLNLKAFFRVTNVLLLLFAAGMVAYGVHELNEAGWIPNLIDHVWDINPILDDKGTFGLFLKALFGYNGNPSLSEVIAYGVYIVVVGVAVFRKPGAKNLPLKMASNP